MAATGTTTATKLIQLRPVYLPGTTIKFFSSPSSTPPDPKEESSPHNDTTHSPPPKSSSSLSSALNNLKATLKQTQGNFQSQTPRTSPASRPYLSSEVIRNLSEFRRRADVTPPQVSHGSATQPTHGTSLSQMYQQFQASKGNEPSSSSSKFPAITALKYLRESPQGNLPINVNNSSANFTKNNQKLSLSGFKETLNLKSGETSGRHSTRFIGDGDNLPSAIFGKETEELKRASANADTRNEFVRSYNHTDLGKKLESLRPDKTGNCFSLQELNDRLMKLRQIDKENPITDLGFLRDSFAMIKREEERKPRPNMILLKQFGGTPTFMRSPPQEHLVEKYFHPDNMSASEKLKLELEKVRDEFKMSESDCGSARVQVAQLTTKIKHLATVLHKKDKHSRKGLLGMVQKRKKLLKYLRGTDWESYCFVLSKLGLRDNPDYKN